LPASMLPIFVREAERVSALARRHPDRRRER
jgi:hypothetical protein